MSIKEKIELLHELDSVLHSVDKTPNEMAWFVIDLGAVQKVHRFHIKSKTGDPKTPLNFTIQASTISPGMWHASRDPANPPRTAAAAAVAAVHACTAQCAAHPCVQTHVDRATRRVFVGNGPFSHDGVPCGVG